MRVFLQDKSKCCDVLEYVWCLPRQFPPVHWTIEWEEESCDCAPQRAAALRAVPSAPIAAIDDRAVNDRSTREVCMHFGDCWPEHRVYWVEVIWIIVRPSDEEISSSRHNFH